ncbi:MAG: LysR family transcriptional regulator [Peptococcaceae bacterium]|jgi:DNA-binding transcriptional LysR family regulator|nr:LysR family transcriptional regulator [Peptococcaceae bacterium]
MEFRQLEAFKLISDTGSFSETAKQMGVTQPSVSSQISALEREFGCQLLTRQPGKAVPTKVGTTLYKYAAEILALRDKAIATYGRHHEMGGTVTVAASSIPYLFVLPVLTAQFSLQYPDASFALTGGDSAVAVELLLAGKADLGMVGTILPRDNLLYEAILEDELMVVAPALPPYTQWQSSPPNTEEILGAPFVAREEGSGTWAEVEHYLEQRGYDGGALRLVARMDNPDAIVKAVEQGMGITILSSLAASEYARKGNILAFPLADYPIKRKIYLARVKGRKLPAVTEAFARFVSHGAEDN